MLTLNDGRSELWQWDTGRKLTVDADCSQVHFSNKVFGRSIDVDVVDGVAIIPDILLQTDKELTAWAFVGTAENGYTKISKVFKVNKRNKPADYVFTPAEQTTLDEIMERLDSLEATQDPDAIENAVEDYLEKNPVESPVQSVNGKTGKVDLIAEDVGAISQDKLQEATNEVLAQAKASGEFNGEDGITPHIGANGNWYLGETDTGVKAQGEDGKDGAPGKDGYTPVKGVDYFDGKDGKDGIDGADGKDGDDYVLTDADKTEIAELASEMVDIPEGGGGIDVSGATVGQTVKISAVDDSGVPTAWEAVDLPSEEWQCIFGSGYSTEVSGKSPVQRVEAEGTTTITQPLGAYYKKLFVRLNGQADAFCTSGNVKLCWGPANSNWHNLQEQKGTAAWTDLWWIVEFCGAYIQVRTAAGNTIKPRSNDKFVFDKTNNLVLTTTTSGATFHNFSMEIWGVKA